MPRKGMPPAGNHNSIITSGKCTGHHHHWRRPTSSLHALAAVPQWLLHAQFHFIIPQTRFLLLLLLMMMMMVGSAAAGDNYNNRSSNRQQQLPPQVAAEMRRIYGNLPPVLGGRPMMPPSQQVAAPKRNPPIAMPSQQIQQQQQRQHAPQQQQRRRAASEMVLRLHNLPPMSMTQRAALNSLGSFQVTRMVQPKAQSWGATAQPTCPCRRKVPWSQMVPVLEDVAPGGYLRDTAPMGSGGQGKVYHGYSRRRHRCVAIKQTDLHEKGDWIKETLSEIELLKELTSKGLSRVVQLEFSHYDRQAKQIYSVLELGDKPLNVYWSDFLKTNPSTIDFMAEIYDLSKQLLTAFVQLHSIGKVVHLDVKPPNVMMMAPEPGQQRGKLKLIDFGGAHHATEDVVRTIIRRMHIASVAYMSPEQRIERYYKSIDGRTDDWVVSYKSDVWSFGSMVYEMLTGSVPNMSLYNMKTSFISDDSEDFGIIYTRMRGSFRKHIESKTTPLNAPLMHMVKACIHAIPMNRPTMKQLLDYMNNNLALTVSSQYNKDVSVVEPGKMFKDFERNMTGPRRQW